MIYRGYVACFERNEDNLFTGRVADIDDIVGFHAGSMHDLEAAFREAVDDYIETCSRIGKSPQKPRASAAGSAATD